MPLKENLKSIRKVKKISQRELAIKSGLSFSMVSKLESGEQSNPSLDTLEKIASALNITTYDLMGWEKYSKIFDEIQQDIEDAKNSSTTFVCSSIHNLLISEQGTEYFHINHDAISPDDFDDLERDILNYIGYCFSKYCGQPSIYDSGQ